MTKIEKFTAIRAILEAKGDAEGVAFVDHEIELLENRKAGDRGLSATQKENVELKAVIVGILESAGEGVTATDVAHAVGEDFTVQRASQLLKQLGAEGLVTKTPAKGKVKALFAVV